MSDYLTNPHDMAAALRKLADDIDALTGNDVEPLELAVQLNIQVCSWTGTDRSRAAVVDAYALALLGVVGASDNSYPVHHRVPYTEIRNRHGIDVSVYSAMKDQAVTV
jgi:hypothetical protein